MTMEDLSLVGIFNQTEIQLGKCIIVNLRKATCISCDKTMYPALMVNIFDGRLKKMFICYSCGDIKA